MFLIPEKMIHVHDCCIFQRFKILQLDLDEMCKRQLVKGRIADFKFLGELRAVCAHPIGV